MMNHDRKTFPTIHVFSLNNDWTGSNRALRSAIEELLVEGYSIVLHTSKQRGHLSEVDGVTIKNNLYKYSHNKFLTGLLFILSQLRSFFYVLLFVSSRKHLVLANTALSVAPIVAGRIKRCYSVMYMHEIYISPSILKGILFALIDAFSSHVIFVSNYLKQQARFKYAEGSVVYNIVPFPCNGKREKPVIFTVLMASSPKNYKGIPEFVKLAHANKLMKFQLVLSCDADFSENYLSQFVLPINLEIILSPDSMGKVYSKASVVLNLSRVDLCIESFGLTIIEAFAFGLPVIVPPKGGPAEIVHDRINGFHIDSRDTAAISNILNQLMIDEDYYSLISSEAQRRCFDFSRHNIVNIFTNKLGY